MPGPCRGGSAKGQAASAGGAQVRCSPSRCPRREERYTKRSTVDLPAGKKKWTRCTLALKNGTAHWRRVPGVCGMAALSSGAMRRCVELLLA